MARYIDADIMIKSTKAMARITDGISCDGIIEYIENHIEPEDIDSALEKQTPVVPVLKNEECLMHINKGLEPHEWKSCTVEVYACAACGKRVGSSQTMFGKTDSEST